MRTAGWYRYRTRRRRTRFFGLPAIVSLGLFDSSGALIADPGCRASVGYSGIVEGTIPVYGARMAALTQEQQLAECWDSVVNRKII